ncbi:MAG: HAD family hydrolase [Dongiaceae bacterium]
MKKRLIAFDLDGTLINSEEAIVHVVRKVAKEFNLTLPAERSQMLAGVGLPLSAALQKVFPELEEKIQQEVVESYIKNHHAYADKDQDVEPLYPGARELVETLFAEGFILGIVTSKGRHGVDRFLQQKKWEKHFTNIQTPDNGPGKPDPFLMKAALKEVGVGPESALMIGDTIFDIQCAKGAGVKSIGVSWGFHHLAQLQEAKPDFLVHKIEEILPVIRQWQ